MAVRQYVGARYVPKFHENTQNPQSMVWEGNKSYEALTVVSYNSDSYTSKIPVPAGIGNPADNPTYWALTGNFNAQVEQYRRETVQAVQTAQDSKTTAENAQKSVEEEAQARESADNNIITQVNILKKPIVISIGDSLCSAWTTETGDRDSLSWVNLPGNAGYTIYAYHNSAGGFTNPGFKQKTYLQMLNEAHTAHPECNILIVETAGNDSGATYGVNLDSNIKTFFQTARQYYPNAKIYFVFTSHSNGFNVSDKYVLERIWNNAALASNADVQPFSLTSRIMLSINGVDKTHFTDDGYRAFANYMYGALEGAIPDATYTTSLAGATSLYAKNDIVQISLGGTGFIANIKCNNGYMRWDYGVTLPTFLAYTNPDKVLGYDNPTQARGCWYGLATFEDTPDTIYYGNLYLSFYNSFGTYTPYLWNFNNSAEAFENKKLRFRVNFVPAIFETISMGW